MSEDLFPPMITGVGTAMAGATAYLIVPSGSTLVPTIVCAFGVIMCTITFLLHLMEK